MKFDYTMDNGKVAEIDTETATKEELKDFIYEDTFDFTLETVLDMGKDLNDEVFVGCVAIDYARDKFKDALPLKEIDKIGDEVTFNLID